MQRNLYSPGSSDSACSLLEILQERAAVHPERVAFRYLPDGEQEQQSLTYGELDRKAQAAGLTIRSNCRPGGRVLLCSDGTEFIISLLGCWYAATIPVPCWQPSGSSGLERLNAVAVDSQPTLVIGLSPQQAARVSSTSSAFKSCRFVAACDSSEGQCSVPDGDRPAIALLQYTSGSTSSPKGVCVTHANLLANEQMIQRAFGQTAESIVVGWLPLYHDMGLIGTVLQPLYSGSCSILMPPSAFVQQPARWLRAITRYRATTSGGPDFAYRLCTERIREGDIQALDLRSWSVAFNGAEPVRLETLTRFGERFAAAGFRPSIFRPCYGLAEASLFVTGYRSASEPRTLEVDLEALRAGRLKVAGDGCAEKQSLVSSGAPDASVDIAIVNPETRHRCDAGEVGEIWVSGPQVADGYFQQPDRTRECFKARIAGENSRGTYLRTGDLGVLNEGELYPTGRLKDLIIVRGENHYPDDIEQTVTSACRESAARAAAAFLYDDHEAVNERLVVVQELSRHGPHAFSELAASARAAVSRVHGLHLYALVFVKERGVPRTSSGKVQRSLCRSRFLAGSLRALHTSIQDASVRACSKAVPPLPLAGLTVTACHARVTDFLMDELARLLGINRGEIKPGQYAPAALGLDSLGAAELKSRVEQSCGVVLPAAAFIDAETVDTLADRIVGLVNERSERPAQTMTIHPVDTPAILISPEQERLWWASQITDHPDTFTLSGAIAIRGPVERQRLERALRLINEQEAALRTVFPRNETGLELRILAAETVPVDWETCFTADGADRAVHLATIATRERHRVRDLTNGPLARWCVVSFHPHDHVVVLTLHHIIGDAWAFVVVLRELVSNYQSERDAEADLPRLSSDDLILPETTGATSSAAETAAYWASEFQGQPGWLRLSKRDPIASPCSIPFQISGELTTALQQESRSSGTTLFTTLLTAGSAALARWTGQLDFVVAVPVLGRVHPGTLNHIGLFSHPLLLRHIISPGETLSAFRRQVHAKLRGALDHQEISLESLLEHARPVRTPGMPVRLPVMFSMLPNRERMLTANGMTFELETFESGDQNVEMLIALRQQEDGVHGEIRVGPGAPVEAESVRQFSLLYLQMLEAIVQTSETPIYEPATEKASETTDQALSLVVASTFATQPIAESFRFWSEKLETRLDVTFAPDGQLFQQLLGAESIFWRRQNSAKILLIRARDFVEAPGAEPVVNGQDSAVMALVAKFIDSLNASLRHAVPSIIVGLAPSLPTADPLDTQRLRQCESLLLAGLAKVAGITIITDETIQRWYPVAEPHDRQAGALADVPFTEEYYAALGATLVRTLFRLHGPRFKMIAVDCDQTLWRGICGEDGFDGVTVDPERRWLQEWLARQHDAGVLLCLCSKNNPDDVRAVFDHWPEMPLTREHFIAEAVNWDPKAQNLCALAAHLQVGLESVAFIDDDPVECAAIRTVAPDVMIIDLPEDPAQIPSMFSHLWAFDPKADSSESRSRTEMHRQERARREVREHAPTMLDFLRELDVRASVQPLRSENIPRASELTFRTTQFTTVGASLSESELRARCGDDSKPACVTVHVKDRLGDYGLVGVVLLRWEPEVIDVEGWALSCRALGRGVEEQCLVALGQLASSHRVRELALRYRKSRRNLPAWEFLQRTGAAFTNGSDGEVLFRLAVADAVGCLEAAEKRWTSPISESQQPSNPEALMPVFSSHSPFSSRTQVEIARTLTSARDLAREIVRRRSAGTASCEFVPPRTATERVVCEIWSELLNIPNVSVTADFFACGGTSMIGVRLLAEIQRRLNTDIPLAALFTSEPTVAGLAAAIDELEIAKSMPADLDAVLGQIESLSDEEVRIRLVQGT